MSMSKQDFIALADTIREHNTRMDRSFNGYTSCMFNKSQIKTLADFCEGQNSNFKRERWLGYIAGENGKNGGKV